MHYHQLFLAATLESITSEAALACMRRDMEHYNFLLGYLTAALELNGYTLEEMKSVIVERGQAFLTGALLDCAVDTSISH